MDQRTGAVTEEVTDIISNRESVVQKLEAFERRLTDMAGEVPSTYSRMLAETADGVTRMADQTATALNPLHQTRTHPGVMFGVAVCAGYVIGRLQARPRSLRRSHAVNRDWSSDTTPTYPAQVVVDD
jgi:hypothetical protein